MQKRNRLVAYTRQQLLGPRQRRLRRDSRVAHLCTKLAGDSAGLLGARSHKRRYGVEQATCDLLGGSKAGVGADVVFWAMAGHGWELWMVLSGGKEEDGGEYIGEGIMEVTGGSRLPSLLDSLLHFPYESKECLGGRSSSNCAGYDWSTYKTQTLGRKALDHGFHLSCPASWVLLLPWQKACSPLARSSPFIKWWRSMVDWVHKLEILGDSHLPWTHLHHIISKWISTDYHINVWYICF